MIPGLDSLYEGEGVDGEWTCEVNELHLVRLDAE